MPDLVTTYESSYIILGLPYDDPVQIHFGPIYSECLIDREPLNTTYGQYHCLELSDPWNYIVAEHEVEPPENPFYKRHVELLVKRFYVSMEHRFTREMFSQDKDKSMTLVNWIVFWTREQNRHFPARLPHIEIKRSASEARERKIVVSQTASLSKQHGDSKQEKKRKKIERRERKAYENIHSKFKQQCRKTAKAQKYGERERSDILKGASWRELSTKARQCYLATVKARTMCISRGNGDESPLIQLLDERVCEIGTTEVFAEWFFPKFVDPAIQDSRPPNAPPRVRQSLEDQPLLRSSTAQSSGIVPRTVGFSRNGVRQLLLRGDTPTSSRRPRR